MADPSAGLGRPGSGTPGAPLNSPAIRAPRGLEKSALHWTTEAAMRMLMNNLDDEVAEKPGELVVYGGIGRAARDWHSYETIIVGAAPAATRTRRCWCSPASRSACSRPMPMRRAC